MTTREIFIQVALDLMQTMGEAAIFLPTVGDPVSLYVIRGERMELQPGGLETQLGMDGISLDYARSALDAIPGRGDVFTVGDVSYTVQAPSSYDDYMVTLIVKEVS